MRQSSFGTTLYQLNPQPLVGGRLIKGPPLVKVWTLGRGSGSRFKYCLKQELWEIFIPPDIPPGKNVPILPNQRGINTYT